MHCYIPRILKAFSLVIVLSFLASVFALGGLLSGLVETVDEEVQVVADGEVGAQVDDEFLELNGEDKYVEVENDLLESTAETVGVDEVGQTAYWLQEDVAHGSITKVTGKKVGHYYVWVCIGNECIPVDPFTASN